MYNPDSFSKYSTIQNRGKSNLELLVLVLEKAKNHVIYAKNTFQTKDYLERGKHILSAVNIFTTLAKIALLNDESTDSVVISRTYEGLAFQIEDLLASKLEANEYDYFINYIESMKQEIQAFIDSEKINEQSEKQEIDQKNQEENTENQQEFSRVFEIVT